MHSSLKRKTSLKAKTPLKAKAPIRAKKSIDRRVAKPKTNKPYKPSYDYKSIFTNDLKKCYITGTRGMVHVHHIFGASNKANSEKYHFLIPLRADWHDMADYGVHFNKELDLKFKRKCQEYWLENYGSKEEFIKIFGMWW